MVFANIFDSKVVNNKGELKCACVVGPKTWGVLGRAVAVLGKVFGQLFIGKFARLWQALHAFPDLNIYRRIIDFRQ
jgi:hypothetical protein